MATLTDYKGLDIVDGATGDGGIALTDNFKVLADRAPFQSASNPGTGDDDTQGFAPGDQWLNTSTSVLWACVSNGIGAAVWKSLYKRTATGLELIPAESGESVSVLGAIRSSSSLILDNTATSGLQIFNTSDQVTDYEKFSGKWISNAFHLGLSRGTTASNRTLRIGVSNNVSSDPLNIYLSIQGSASPFFRFVRLSSVAGEIADYGGVSLTGASVSQSCLSINPVINQSGTSSYTALKVNPSETTTGSGTKLLADFQVGGTSKARLDSGGNFVASGYMRIGSTSTPTNTTPGDLTAVRLSLGNGSLSAGTFARLNGTTTETASGTTVGISNTLTISPGANSAAQFRAFVMSAAVNTSSSFSDYIAATFSEVRPTNCGSASQFSAFKGFGLIMGPAAVSCGNVSRVITYDATPVSSFSNSIVATITSAYGLRVGDSGAGLLTISGQAGIAIDPLEAATNNTAVLLGTTTIPSGNFAIYSASNNPSLLSGNLQFTNGTGLVAGTSTGFSIGTSTSQKLGFWNTTPVAQQVLATGASKTVDDVITLLQTLGLCRQS